MKTTSRYDPKHRFDLDYLVDNGQLAGWPTAIEPNCILVQWRDDGTWSVLDANDRPIGWGETEDDAILLARCELTDRRRKRDGVIPARV